jgi:enoyl-CoA hydratase/carnithine racemase
LKHAGRADRGLPYRRQRMDILIERAEGVLSIVLNRPDKKNAITAAMYQEMADGFYEAEKDATVRAVLMRGNGGVFSAGNDLDDFLNDPPKDLSAPVFEFLRRISTCPKPVVAAAAGVAVGIGTTMLLHCDLVYAASATKFSLPFAQLGLCPEAASSMLLPRIAGYQRAAEKLLTGEAFDATEAMNMGFVNGVLDAAELDAYAFAKAKKLAALPASSLRVTKSLMKSAQAVEVQKRMEEEAGHFARMLTAPEAREAFEAFFEKRKPDFSRFE